MSRYLFGVLQRGYLELRYRGDTAQAVALVDSALGTTPLDSLLRADRRYDDVARFFLAAGRRERVGPLLVAAEKNDSALHRTLLAERLWTRGLLALSQGRLSAAVDTLRMANERHSCTICVLPDVGRAYDRAGRLREAASVYEQYLTTPWYWRYESDAVELGWTLERLGDLAEQLGDTTRAAAARTQLRQLWKDADPELVRSWRTR